MRNRRLLNRRRASLLVTGVSTGCLMLAYEATKQALHPTITLWTSHFLTIAFTTALAVALRFVLQRQEDRARQELSAESKGRQCAEEKSCSEALVRGQMEAQLQRNEERMRLAFDTAKIGFWDWDMLTGEIVWSAFEGRQLGLPEDSPTSFAVFMNAVHPDDRKTVQGAIDDATQGHKDYAIEYRVLWPDSSLHWRFARGHAFYDQTGGPVRMVGIAVDIDERKGADERLLLQVAALQAAANSIVITDNKGTILWTNQAFSQLTGYNSEEALGNNPRLLKSGKQDAAFYAALWNTITAGNVWHGEVINRKKDGSLYTEEMTITPVRSDAGVISHYVAIKQDITQRKLAEQELRNAEQKYRRIFENTVLGIFETTPEGEFLSVNPALALHAGYDSPADFLDRVHSTAQLYVDPKRRDELRELIRTQKVVQDFEAELTAKDGSKRMASISVGARVDRGGTNFYLEGTVQDITQRKLAEQALRNAEQKYRSIFENAVLGIFQTNTEGDFVSVNPALARLAGYDSPEDFLNSVHGATDIYVDLKRRDELRELVLAQKVVRDFEVEFKTKNGGTRTTSINVGAVADSEGTNFYLEGTVQDITERKAAEARVQFLAYHDDLTGLPNRVLFEDRLAQALANARRREEQVAVLWLDLDNFKTINDSLGHSIGDLLLKQVGERLHRYTRAQDTVAKAGGDEFIFALINPGHISRAKAAAERIRRAVAGEFQVQGHVLNLTCSIGISLFPDHGGDSETLLKNADQAMYCAKENGRNNFRFFTSELNDRAMERLTLENSLRVALEKRELFLVYQPQLEIATGRITGGEALLRWRHPELGLVAPDRFIPIAENSGLIVPIGEWVLRTACTQARHWQDQGLPALPIAVNVSAVQLHQGRFLPLVRRVLDETGLARQYLELELTERVLLSNTKQMLSLLQELAHMGVQLSIDDFGTGYSSLSYLQDLPVCKLKIDRSFVNAMTLNPRDAAIIAAVISMGNSLNLKVLAEGVETEEQMSFLRAHGCDEIQGFYFSQPLDADAFADKVRTSWLQPDLPRFAPKLLPATALAPRNHEDVLRSSR
jgi:diguanylate cyclase (GGDEF)-like protein/PAS domain S-box-containing protein